MGGFATILTNSMGPLLNVFLLTLKLNKAQFVGTRATFFVSANTLKIILRFMNGSLPLSMIWLGLKFSLAAIVGVYASKPLLRNMSQGWFTTLEYSLMTYASLKLLDAGFETGVFERLMLL